MYHQVETCSSPPPSPAYGPVDSSPPSSPGLVPYSLDSPTHPGTFTSSFSPPSHRASRCGRWRSIHTERTIGSARARSFGRTQLIMNFGKERHVLNLNLMGNIITSLPPELFSVKNISVLSLPTS
ncbi:hypothetical protein OG21DRAFT_634353 [Imleria badia]|nr:hypothetical protein OG21DRAFT_634353 [Imleria badia]